RTSDLRQPDLCWLCRRPRQCLREALQTSGSRVHGPQLKPRIWLEPQYRTASLRCLQKPLESRALGGWLLGWRGGRGERWYPAGGPRDRRRWLDPHPGRVSLAPDAGEGWGGMSVGHVLSRSVRDCALMLDCTAGYEPGDPYTAPSPAGAFVEAISRPPRRLKIALMHKDHRGVKPHTECVRAVDGAAKLCQSLGHVVEEADPGIDLVALRPQTSAIAAANTARALG